VRAIGLDPSYAYAWAAIASVYRVLIDDRQIALQDGLAKQELAVQRALALAPGLAAAHLKATQYYWDIGDDPKAMQHFEQAVALAPGDPLVLATSAGFALDAGDLDRAITLQTRAVAIDPLSARSRTELANYFIAANQLAEARSQITKALELSPNSLELNATLAQVLILLKQFEHAQVAALESPEGPVRDHSLALLYYATGRTAQADAVLARLVSAGEGINASADVTLMVAEVYAHRGSIDDAFQWLDRAKRKAMSGRGAEPGWDTRMRMTFSPFLARLHADQRWEKLVRNRWKT
jgi:tetratricopeptide (TPR) repeat protein